MVVSPKQDITGAVLSITVTNAVQVLTLKQRSVTVNITLPYIAKVESQNAT